ncbi:MAG: hypothetical protein D6718_11445 [Acidobacteria bacterium]|nr:MAG: hypothetical protein D6718_11445 [Acidobacteriota bacterium]
MSPTRMIRCAVWCLGAAVASSAGALALTDEEIFRDFPFNLQNPGGRALGIGGAFISLADDSSAAQANPAGLARLRRPELFAELRAFSHDASATRISVPLDTNVFTGTLAAGADVDPAGAVRPAFLSYVLPGRLVSFGFSRMESLDVRARAKNSFSVTGLRRVFDVGPDGRPVPAGTEVVDQEAIAEADVATKIEQYNVAVSVALHRRFSIGLTAVFGRIDIDGRTDNLFRDRSVTDSVPVLDYATRIDDSDTALGANVGILWRPTDHLSFGAVYRRGLRFEVRETVPEVGANAPSVREQFGAEFANKIATPDSYGIGVAFRPTEPLTFFLDAVRVEYSDLLEGYIAGLNRITFPDRETPFAVDDGTEIHFGVEKLFLAGSVPVAARIGVWTDPDHRIRSTAPGLDQVFPAGDDLTHYSAGVGVTLDRIQFDFAVDRSRDSATMVASTIYRF